MRKRKCGTLERSVDPEMVRLNPTLVAPYRPLPFYKPLGPGLCPAAAVHHQHLLHGWNLESEWESKAANEREAR